MHMWGVEQLGCKPYKSSLFQQPARCVGMPLELMAKLTFPLLDSPEVTVFNCALNWFSLNFLTLFCVCYIQVSCSCCSALGSVGSPVCC